MAIRPIAMYVKFSVPEEVHEPFLGLLEEMSTIVAAESDTLEFGWYTDDSSPEVIWLFELYRDTSAVEKHRANSGHLVRQMIALAGEPVEAVGTPIWRKRAEQP